MNLKVFSPKYCPVVENLLTVIKLSLETHYYRRSINISCQIIIRFRSRRLSDIQNPVHVVSIEIKSVMI